MYIVLSVKGHSTISSKRKKKKKKKHKKTKKRRDNPDKYKNIGLKHLGHDSYIFTNKYMI